MHVYLQCGHDHKRAPPCSHHLLRLALRPQRTGRIFFVLFSPSPNNVTLHACIWCPSSEGVSPSDVPRILICIFTGWWGLPKWLYPTSGAGFGFPRVGFSPVLSLGWILPKRRIFFVFLNWVLSYRSNGGGRHLCFPRGILKCRFGPPAPNFQSTEIHHFARIVSETRTISVFILFHVSISLRDTKPRGKTGGHGVFPERWAVPESQQRT